MTVAEYERMVEPLDLSPTQRFAIWYLESRGIRFAVDYGYSNCVEVSVAVARERLQKAQALRERAA